ncbi:translation elongation factor Ts [Candidiatus Paracoxiella cheracis]|uniref:translation elongation factor Ts n=1 Tax=Candidiatus Paracoxiella cheracis TaxID=3405120 RepID=UPI003BF60EB0
MAITAALVKELRERTGAAMMACKKALVETDGNLEAAIDVLRKAGEAKAEKRAGKTAAEGKIVIAITADNKKAFMVEVNSETDFVARDTHFAEFAQHVAEQGLAENIRNVDSLAKVTITQGGNETIEQARMSLINKLGENIQIRRVALIESSGIVGHYCHGDRIGVVVALDKDNLDLAKDLAMHIAALKPQAVKPDDVPAEVIEKEREIFIEQAKESGKPQDIIEKMVLGRINKFLKEITLVGQPFVKDPNQLIADLLKSQGATVSTFARFEVGEGIEKESKNFADEVMAQVQGND